MVNYIKAKKQNPTRGYGFLENFLSVQRSKIADRLIPNELRNGKILDIGCGSSPLFLNNIIFTEKHGIDKIECSNIKGIEFINHDTEKIPTLPYPDNFFEVVTSLAVIEHIEPEKFLRLVSQIRRVLRPNGLLILTTPASWSDGLLKIMTKFKLVSSVEIEDHKKVYTIKELKIILYKSGFQRNKIQAGYFECFANIWITGKK